MLALWQTSVESYTVTIDVLHCSAKVLRFWIIMQMETRYRLYTLTQACTHTHTQMTHDVHQCAWIVHAGSSHVCLHTQRIQPQTP